MIASSRESIELIPEWLGATGELEIATGLSREEALLRARKLRHLIREGRVSAKEVELDEEGKDVLHALVKLLGENAEDRRQSIGAEADTIYRFLRSIQWIPDPFEEKAALLRKCAEVGWRSIDSDLSAVFRRRRALALEVIPEFVLPEQSHEIVSTWFSLKESETSRHFVARQFGELETWWAACLLLRRKANVTPATVARKSAELFIHLTSGDFSIGVLDETDYLAGEFACSVAGPSRHLGSQSEAHGWLEKAQAFFSRTVTLEWSMAEVSFNRLALMHDMGDWRSVQAGLPKIVSLYREASAKRALARCGVLKAASLKGAGQLKAGTETIAEMRASALLENQPDMIAWTLVLEGELCTMLGDLSRAFECYSEASNLLASTDLPMLRANLDVCIGEALRQEGKTDQALHKFFCGLEVFEALLMKGMAGRIRLNIAETLLSIGRDREAIEHLLASLAAIEEQRMVPEGIAAVALLKESVRRCKADPNKLKELQVRLQSRFWE